jgi:hypothetical protein
MPDAAVCPPDIQAFDGLASGAEKFLNQPTGADQPGQMVKQSQSGRIFASGDGACHLIAAARFPTGHQSH